MKQVLIVLVAALALSGCMGNSLGITPPTRAMPTLYPWMSPEVQGAWNDGYFGQGTAVTVVDNFNTISVFGGNLGTGTMSLTHAEWVRMHVNMIAPDARLFNTHFNSTSAIPLAAGQLNILNLSYGVIGLASDSGRTVAWSALETSILQYARDGTAVVVKAAGNDAVAVGAPAGTRFDFLNRDLIGLQTTVFAGALDRNGTPSDPARLASYSNFAGTDTRVQGQFISVGVRSDLTGISGTSFAAPIISGYVAILGSKFTTATPTQITNQLLSTARTDTIFGYDRALHGVGEASIARALAPMSIN